MPSATALLARECTRRMRSSYFGTRHVRACEDCLVPWLGAKGFENLNPGTMTVLVEISLFSLIACIFYAVASGASLRAAIAARSKGQQTWHFRTWIFATVLFALLIISRLLGFEEILREDLRDWLGSEGLTDNRRAIQGPIIAVVIIVFSALAMGTVYWVAQRLSGRRNIAVAIGLSACGVMLATIAARTVSLHALDRLLNGPLKLNWVGDMGATVAVAGAAIVYVWVIGQKPAARASRR